MIVIQPVGDDERDLWYSLLDLAEASKDWTLIGARMVELHVAQAGRTMARMSRDGDALADARGRPYPVRRLSKILEGMRFGLDPKSAGRFGTGHRFKRGNVEIDVLAPDHLGDRAKEARITIPPFHTVSVPGGTQALHRTEWVEVEIVGRRGRLPCPNLVGAILIKARAVSVSSRPDDQRRDLALLLSLVDDPRQCRDQFSARERNWLRARAELDGPEAFFWRELRPEEAQRGLAAYRYLS